MTMSVQIFDERLRQKLLREGWFLRERLASACQVTSLPPVNSDHEALLAWQAITAPDHPNNFDKRLEWSGASHPAAAWAGDPPAGAAPQAPPWLLVVEETANACRLAAATACESETNSRPDDEPPLPFEDLWQAVVTFAGKRLHESLAPFELQGIASSVLTALEHSLLRRLCYLTEQPLWEQFSSDRNVGEMLLAHVNVGAADSDQRDAGPGKTAYRDFINGQLESGLARLLGDYPVLGRLIGTAVSLWTEASKELLKRLHQDRKSLEATFGIESAASLKGIKLGLSDPHRGGRAVAILTFAGDVKVVYKPKDLRVDATYQSFLSLCNELADEVRFRALAILPRDGYGYVEWVEHRLCTSEAEFSRFYRNAGRLMAVLYALGCTDCHHENLIASGEQLVLIDSETLLEGDVPDHVDGGAENVSDLQKSMGRSVLRIGLLPQWLFAGGGSVAMDVSALGVAAPQEREQPGWLGINSDGMLPGRLKKPMELPTSSPSDSGAENVLHQYLEPLCDGFAEQYLQFLEHRDTFLADGGPLDAFRGLPRRVVLRSTQIYFALQQQSLEPESLKTATAFGFKLEQMCRSYVIGPEKPRNWPVFDAELRDMEQLDIPFFEHYIDDDTLRLGHGLRAIKGFLEVSGLESAHRRMTSLSESDLDFQRQLINGSVQARQLRQSGSSGGAEQGSPGASSVLEGTALLDEAIAIGWELRERAIRDEEGRLEWLGIDLGADMDKFRFGLVGASLYGGRCGIALFFGALAQQLANRHIARKFRTDVDGIVEPLLTLVKESDDYSLYRWLRDQPLGLSGTGGALLTLLELHRQNFKFKDGDPLETAHRLAVAITAERLERDTSYDVMAGCAGLIGPLLQLHQATGDNGLLELATTAGDHLNSHLHETGGWRDPTMGSRPLTGFSHGAAGVAAALGRLYAVSSDDRYREAALRGLMYERNCFVPEVKNWPDFRESSEPEKFMQSWCHGAPGIALARLCLKDTAIWDETCQEETRTALESTANSPHAGPDHVCCGNFGKAAILQQAGQILGEAQWNEKSLELASNAVHRRHTQGRYQLFSTWEADLWLPGFFTGVAGIGFQLLALNDPRLANPMLSAGLLNLDR